MTRRRLFSTLLVAMLGSAPLACTKVYPDRTTDRTATPTPTAPTPTPTPTPAPVPVADRIEFRVLGTNLSAVTPAIVRHTDALNGTTLYTGAVPYFVSFTSLDTDVFLYIEAQAVGANVTATLQVQIYVNGRLFREAFAQGLALNAQASGTFRR
jgi:hypothetical protein